MKSVAEVLREAATIIEQRGWTTGTLLENDGRCCVLGGIALALGVNPSDYDGSTYAFLDEQPSVEAFAKCVSPKTTAYMHGYPRGRIYVNTAHTWNDGKAGSKDVVIAKLRECADAQEGVPV